MKKHDSILQALIMILIFLIGYYVGHNTKRERYGSNLVIQRDTIVITKPSKPIVIENVKTKIMFRRDTIIETKPFIAQIDTIVLHDTIQAKYLFPDNLFSLKIQKQPDSLILQNIYLGETKQKGEWWQKPALLLGGFIAGFIVSRAVR